MDVSVVRSKISRAPYQRTRSSRTAFRGSRDLRSFIWGLQGAPGLHFRPPMLQGPFKASSELQGLIAGFQRLPMLLPLEFRATELNKVCIRDLERFQGSTSNFQRLQGFICKSWLSLVDPSQCAQGCGPELRKPGTSAYTCTYSIICIICSTYHFRTSYQLTKGPR